MMVQSSAGTIMQASSHWLVSNDVMSGLGAVGLQSDAIGNGAQDLISADDFLEISERAGGDRPATPLRGNADQVNEMRERGEAAKCQLEHKTAHTQSRRWDTRA